MTAVKSSEMPQKYKLLTCAEEAKCSVTHSFKHCLLLLHAKLSTSKMAARGDIFCPK